MVGHVLGRKPATTPHPRAKDRVQKADQVEVGNSRGAFEQKKGGEIPPTSVHADSTKKKPVKDHKSAKNDYRLFVRIMLYSS
jgi:hypothetical protein